MVPFLVHPKNNNYFGKEDFNDRKFTMGLWNLLKNISDPETAQCLWKVLKNIGNAEATRESMRYSYKKHLRGAIEGKISMEGLTAHQVALWGALGERYEIKGFKINTSNIMQTLSNQQMVLAELLPFLYLSEDESREALVEYVIYKEYPKDAKVSWLTNIVQKGHKITREKDDLYEEMMKLSKTKEFAWLLLLSK